MIGQTLLTTSCFVSQKLFKILDKAESIVAAFCPPKNPSGTVVVLLLI